MAVAITATEQSDYPPRVLVSVTGLTVGDSIELYRVVGGVRTPVRAGSAEGLLDTSFLRTDAEIPFDVPVSYVAVVNGLVEYTTTATSYKLPGGKVAVTDAVSGKAAEVVILAWDEKAYSRQSSVFKVGGRNVVVSGDLGMFEGDLELYTETTSSRDNLAATLEAATEGVVQIRQPGGYDGVDSYLAVLGMTERRFSQDGSDQRRIFALHVAEVESWATFLEALGFTLQDIANVYDVTGAALNANPYFETDATSWTATQGTIARSTAQSHQGVASLLLTPNGSGTQPRAESNKVAASPGASDQASAWVRCAVARDVEIAASWYTAGSVLISTSSQAFPVAANTWTLLTATFVAPGTTGQASAVVRMTGTPTTITEDFEDTTYNVTITGTWARDSTQKHAGSWSFKSATIADSQQTDMVVTVPGGATSMSFWYMVDSEVSYDKFQVLLDGANVFEDTGNVGWTAKTINVTGVSQVTFRYKKDVSVSIGADAAWIDDLSFSSPGAVPAGNTLYIDEATISAVQTLNDLSSDYATLLDIAQGDFS